MREAKNTQRALVRIGFDGKVHKTFRGPKKTERYKNEVRVLRYLEQRKCPFVPRLLDCNDEKLEIVTSNCGALAPHISTERADEVFDELKKYGVRHEDPFPRNITYRATDGRFCAIDFEFATILEELSVVASDEALNTDANATPAITQLNWSGCTDRGRFRPNNEDAFLGVVLDEFGIRYLGKSGSAEIGRQDFIFAVSDGMGGARSGEFASRIALQKITSLLPKQFELSRERFLVYSAEIMEQLFTSIHSAMLDLGRYDPNCEDMGATLTLAWLRFGRLYYGHIGDSRLYHLPVGGEMRQVTEDHTHVGWLRREGKINEREARTHPRKNALAQALGAGHRYLRPQLGNVRVSSGDRFLICSDGVIEGLWDHALADLLAENDSTPESHSRAAEIVWRAVRESGKDNTTAVVVEAI